MYISGDRLLIVSDIIEKDSYFYSELEDVLEDFEGITTLYNHVRSYVTQKPYSTVKFKLHFRFSYIGKRMESKQRVR